MSHNLSELSAAWSSAASSPATFAFGISPMMSPLESPAMSPSILGSSRGPSGAQLIPRVIAAVAELNERFSTHEWSVKPDGGLVIINKETGIRATTCPHPSCAKGVANKRSNCVSRHFASNHAPNTLPFICGGNCPSRTNRRDHFIAHLKRNSARCAAYLLMNAAADDVIKMMQVCYPPSKEPSWELALARDTNPANVDAQLRKRGTSLDAVIPGASTQFNLQQPVTPSGQPAAVLHTLPAVPGLMPFVVPSNNLIPSPIHKSTPASMFLPMSNVSALIHPASAIPPASFSSSPYSSGSHWNHQTASQLQMTIPQVVLPPTETGGSSLMSLPWALQQQSPSSASTASTSMYNSSFLNYGAHAADAAQVPVIDWSELLSPAPAPSLAAVPGPLPLPTAEQLAAQNAMFDWLTQPLGSPTVTRSEAPNFSLTISEPVASGEQPTSVPQIITPSQQAAEGDASSCPIASLFSDLLPSN